MAGDMRMNVVYGTGEAARDLMASGLLASDTVRFASTDGGTVFWGQEVLSLEQLVSLSYERIVIASSFLHEIVSAFEKKGIDLSKVYWYFADEKQLIAWDKLKADDPSTDELLFAFYDLAINPSTFDATVFAARAEMERQHLGKRGIHFVLVPSLLAGGRPGDRERYKGTNEVAWRQQYIVEAIFRLIPGFAGFTQLPARDGLVHFLNKGYSCFPANFDPARPVDTHRTRDLVLASQQYGLEPRVFSAPSRAKAQAQQWLDGFCDGRRLIVVTLREYDFQVGRNSKLNEWRQFLSDLDPSIYAVVLVRDSDRAFEPTEALSDFISCPFASIDLNYRIALYELAYLNLSVSTGPCCLMLLSPCIRYVIFKVWLEEYSCTKESFHLERSGLAIGDSLPFADEHQKYVWADDDAAVMAEEFAAAVARLESQDNKE